jgi:hypothetical protein
MKAIKKWVIGIFVLLIPLGLYSQDIEDRKVKEFDQIRIFGKLKVLMVPGTENNVHIESKNVNLDKIDTEIEEKELKIKMTSKLLKSERPDVFVRVSYNNLKGITALADAEVEFDKPIVQDSFMIKATSGTNVTLTLDTRVLEIRVSQGGKVLVEGETDTLEGYANTGGILTGTDLICQKADIKMNTGGKGEITVKNELEANINTGSDFSYFGTPEVKDVSTALGGSVSAWDEE